MRLHIVLDLPDIDPAQVDPHTLTDELLREELNTFITGEAVLHSGWFTGAVRHPSIPNPEDFTNATFVSAEWEDS